jgi:hypothetical protein
MNNIDPKSPLHAVVQHLAYALQFPPTAVTLYFPYTLLVYNPLTVNERKTTKKNML